MSNDFSKTILVVMLVVGLLTTSAMASRALNKAKIEADAKEVEQMIAAGDVDGLVDMLGRGEFPSKVTAAEHLGDIGYELALSALKGLNKAHGGWVVGEIHEDHSGAFAVAICKILTRNSSTAEQIDALFELLGGKGPAVPESIEPGKMTVNGVLKDVPRRLDSNLFVGRSVAAELEKYDDPAVVVRLRQSTNRGAVETAVWMEVRGMEKEAAIARCVEIAKYEDWEQRWGAIMCLVRFQRDAIEALDELASEGYSDAIEALRKIKGHRPGFHTDLAAHGEVPISGTRKLKAKIEALEKQASKALKMGPLEEAMKLYGELSELRPDYKPYEKAIEKAQAYVAAAGVTTEKWYPEAPYVGLKGRYSYLLVHEPKDMSILKNAFELAQYLGGNHFEGWSDIFGGNAKGEDQYEKALKLYEHIVANYPENEYKVIRAKAATGGLKLNLYKDVKACILAYIDVFAIAVEDVVDGTDPRRNEPLESAGGKTQAQLDFERHYKDHMRARTIELCSRPLRPEVNGLLDEIIEKCAQTDPKIVEMAKAAKVEVQRQLIEESEREKAAGHH